MFIKPFIDYYNNNNNNNNNNWYDIIIKMTLILYLVIKLTAGAQGVKL